MYILGISESHNSTAALLKDGQIIACVQEERFTRVKNQGSFPKKSVEFCLKQAGISSQQLDLVVFGYQDLIGSIIYAQKQQQQRQVTFLANVKFFLFGHLYLMSRIFSLIFVIYHFFHYLIHILFPPLIRWYYTEKLSKELQIAKNKIKFADHHLCHGLAAYYIFGQFSIPCLIITNDGAGDRVCGKVFVVKDDQWQEIAATSNKYSLAFLYYYVTQFLGFTPDEEEYKVMGLAPYTNESVVKKILPILKGLIWVDGLSFKSKIPREGYFSFIRAKLAGYRFDHIARALQKVTEDLVVEQIRNAIDSTGIRQVYLGGGLAMNIKANMQAIDHPPLEKLSVCPAAGDESTAIGACFWGYLKKCQMSNVKCQIEPVNNLYLGPGFDKQQIDDVTQELKNNNKYSVQKVKNKDIAKLLSQGKIIARFSGRMEFGSRALGNRSILADPRDPKIVKIINSQIKQRDFWMPFAPVILKEQADKYLVNPKKIDSPFMMIGFKTTKEAQQNIPAALHPADSTCRPQILKKEGNPQFYDLIKEFERLTRVGVLLNTSFNLHREPIVCTPQDAIRTFKNSGLDYLVIEDYLIKKVFSKPR